jgi:hypothetical protein
MPAPTVDITKDYDHNDRLHELARDHYTLEYGRDPIPNPERYPSRYGTVPPTPEEIAVRNAERERLAKDAEMRRKEQQQKEETRDRPREEAAKESGEDQDDDDEDEDEERRQTKLKKQKRGVVNDPENAIIRDDPSDDDDNDEDRPSASGA